MAAGAAAQPEANVPPASSGRPSAPRTFKKLITTRIFRCSHLNSFILKFQLSVLSKRNFSHPNPIPSASVREAVTHTWGGRSRCPQTRCCRSQGPLTLVFEDSWWHAPELISKTKGAATLKSDTYFTCAQL